MQAKGSQSIALMVLGIVWGIRSSISLQRSRIILTDKQGDIQIGFPWKRSLINPLNEITRITFNQPALGAMLNFGKIILAHQEKKKYGFRFIPRPVELVTAVEEAIVPLPGKEEPDLDRTLGNR